MHKVIGRGLVRTVFQPVVDLDTSVVVAYEALSRGPAGPLERPDLLFEAARDQGRLADLDALCRATALRSAADVGIAAPVGLFLNVEPEVLDVEGLDALVEMAQAAPCETPVVLDHRTRDQRPPCRAVGCGP